MILDQEVCYQFIMFIQAFFIFNVRFPIECKNELSLLNCK